MAGAAYEPVSLFSDAITRGDLDAALAVCDPEIVFHSVIGISGRAYVGHDGIREYWEDVASAWEQWRFDVEQVEEGADGRVAIVLTMHARGKESGAPLMERTAHVWTIRDGRLLCNEPFRDPELALRALRSAGRQ